MEKFNPARPCPKCGSRMVMFQHWTGIIGRREYMRRDCVDCGASWKELPLDAKEEKGEKKR